MQAQGIRWLEEIEPSDEQAFGAALVALGRLARSGLSVSPGFAVSTVKAEIIKLFYTNLEEKLNHKDLMTQVSIYCNSDKHCRDHSTRHFAIDGGKLHSVLQALARQYDHAHVFLVQAAITSETSGSIATHDRDSLAVVAIAGEIEPLLEHRLPGDKYILARGTSQVISRDHNKQSWQLTRHANQLRHTNVASIEQSYPKLNESLLAGLAELYEEATRLIGEQYTVYWSIDSRNRPWIQSLAPAKKNVTQSVSDSTTVNHLPGLIAARGHATGPARIVHGRMVSHVEPDSIIVTELADHGLISLLPTLRGIVTETGRIDSQLATATRAAGIPYIYGVRGATHKLREGQLITVNGDHGFVSIGKVRSTATQPPHPTASLVTGTKVYTYLGPTSSLSELAKPESDGIGLLAIDSLLNHPVIGQEITNDHYQVADLILSLQEIAGALAPRPVFLSLSDQSPDSNDTSGHRLLGYRGALRHLSEPELLQIELEAIAKVRELGLDNIFLTLPFVRTYDELTRLQGTLSRFGLTPAADFKLSLLCQTPANVINLEQYIRDGAIQSITLDLDSLTELTLGFDRELDHFGHEYGTNDNAIQTSLKHCIDLCRHYGVSINAIGDDLENEPELIAALVHMGVTSLTVPPEDVMNTRHLIASAEQRLLLDHALNDLQQ